jgi:hypothetical protein
MTQAPYGPPIHPTPHRGRRSRAPIVLLILGGLAVAIAGAGFLLYTARPKSVTITGTMALSGEGFDQTGKSCTGKDGYDDIREGTNVVIHDAVGKVIATGALDAGTPMDFDDMGGVLIKPVPQHCSFAFSVPDVSAEKFYGVEVGHRGTVTFTAAQVKSGGLRLSLGS